MAGEAPAQGFQAICGYWTLRESRDEQNRTYTEYLEHFEVVQANVATIEGPRASMKSGQVVEHGSRELLKGGHCAHVTTRSPTS